MELKHQVVSLELAQKMEKLGFKQDSLWWWYYGGKGKANLQIVFKNKEKCYSSYTTAELGEMLAKYGCYGSWQTNKKKWAITKMFDKDFPELDSDTEADARALMLIYLKENNLI